MDIISLLQYTFGKVVETFSHNWWLLLISILISAALKLYIDQDAIARFLRRNKEQCAYLHRGRGCHTVLFMWDDGRCSGNDGIYYSMGPNRCLHGCLASHIAGRIVL